MNWKEGQQVTVRDARGVEGPGVVIIEPAYPHGYSVDVQFSHADACGEVRDRYSWFFLHNKTKDFGLTIIDKPYVPEPDKKVWSGPTCSSAEAEAAIALMRPKAEPDPKDAEIAALKQESANLTKALTGLTCGGSEFFVRRGERFVADADACVEYVMRTGRNSHERRLAEAKSNKAKDAEIERLRGALEPFAAMHDEAVKPFPGTDVPREVRPADQIAWGFNGCDLRWGDFARARQALSTKKEGE